MTNVEQVIRNILDREKMPVPSDPGDGTGLNGAGGQTQPWLQTWNLPFPETEAEAAANLTMWLAKTSLMQVVNASLPLGDAVADFCYNISLRGGVKALQAALDVAQDGVIGPQTLDALHLSPALASLVRDVAIGRIKALAQGVASHQTKPELLPGLVNRALLFL